MLEIKIILHRVLQNHLKFMFRHGVEIDDDTMKVQGTRTFLERSIWSFRRLVHTNNEDPYTKVHEHRRRYKKEKTEGNV